MVAIVPFSNFIEVNILEMLSKYGFEVVLGVSTDVSKPRCERDVVGVVVLAEVVVLHELVHVLEGGVLGQLGGGPRAQIQDLVVVEDVGEVILAEQLQVGVVVLVVV